MTTPAKPVSPTAYSAHKGPIAATKNIPAARALVDEQFTLEDVDPIGRTEVLIYAPPGGGKTVMATTFPGPFRWIAADGASSLKAARWAVQKGIASIKDLKELVAFVPKERPEGYYIGPAQAFHQMEDMIDFWFTPEQVDKWQTLVLDSFTEINEWAIDLGLDINAKTPQGKPLSQSDKINREAKVRLLTGQQDYKSAMGLIAGFLRNTRLLCAQHNKNLVVLCHEWTETREDDDDVEQVVRYLPLLIGQLRQRVVKDFDDVWHMEKYNKGTGVEVKVRVHGDNKTLAKTRWGDVLPREVEASYPKMIETVRAYYAK